MSPTHWHYYLLTLATWLGWVAQTPGADWPRFRGEDMQGVSSETTITDWPTGGPPIVWQREDLLYGFGSLAVCEGKIYLANSFKLEALAAGTGQTLWSVSSQVSGVHSTPTVYDGRVYFYCGSGQIFCLNPADGKILWQTPKSKFATQPLEAYSQSPWVENGRVFVSISGATNCLQAYSATNGALLWQGLMNRCAFSSPVGATIHGVRQILFPDSWGVIAVEPETGRVLWDYHPGYNTYCFAPSPVVSGDLVLAGLRTEAIQIRYTNGQFNARCVWTNTWAKTNYGEDYYTTLVVHEDHAYILDTGGKLSCHRLTDGLIRWQTNVDYGSIIKAGANLVVLTHSGNLVLAKATPEGYQPLGATKNRTHPDFVNSPAFSNGRLYARNAHELICFDLAPPSLRLHATWARETGQLRLHVTCANGAVIATDRRPNIGLVWSENLALPLSQWTPLAISLVYTNGELAGEAPFTPATRYYTATEQP
jgi:outer membrane protein assembly factor BamB